MTYSTQQHIVLPRRVPVLPYQRALHGTEGMGEVGGNKGFLAVAGLLVAAVVGVGLYMSAQQAKAEASVREKLAEKEGAEGLARYEEARLRRSAGERGLNLLSSWLSPPMQRNRKRTRSRRRRASRARDEE